MAGLYFEEFTVGQTFDHSIRRTITETDNVLITTMTHNPASLHLDAEYMKDTEFGKPIVNSCLFAATAVEVPAIDTVYTDFRDVDGLAKYAANARRDGSSGWTER